jgi:hypothetical protein
MPKSTFALCCWEIFDTFSAKNQKNNVLNYSVENKHCTKPQGRKTANFLHFFDKNKGFICGGKYFLHKKCRRDKRKMYFLQIQN